MVYGNSGSGACLQARRQGLPGIGLLRSLLWTGLSLLLLLGVAWPGAAQAARLALVIGNDDYAEIADLKNARADAQTMAEALRAVGYEVTLRTDRGQREMLDDVRAFRQRIRGGDEVVFFFAGHGLQIGPSNYLLPTNVRSQNEDQVRDDALELSRVLFDLRAARPAFTLAIIDACRDNPFASQGRSIGGRGLTGVAGANGQMVIYAAGEGQQALDRVGPNDQAPNGLFTRVFASQLRQPGVAVHQVLRNVRGEVARVARTIGHVQVPAIYDQVEGDYFFVAGAAPTVSPLPAAAPAPAPTHAPTPAPIGVGSVVKDCAECPELVVLPEGRFRMGSPEAEAGREKNEGPVREVVIGYRLAVGRSEVSRAEFGRFVSASGYLTEAERNVGVKGCAVWTGQAWEYTEGRNWHSPGFEQGEVHPVVCVSWNDAQAYVKWLNERAPGRGYRLLSEAEWEYAARAGTVTRYTWGDDLQGSAQCLHANGGDETTKSRVPGFNNFAVAGCRDGHAYTAPALSLRPNAFGLLNMHGNAWEWVTDVWHDDYTGGPTDGSSWTTGGYQARRVLRGGSWYDTLQYLRSAFRIRDSPVNRSGSYGFRIARTF